MENLEGVVFKMMEEEVSEHMGKLVKVMSEKLLREAYQQGYTKGVIDGGKKFVSHDVGVSIPSPVIPKPCVRGIDMRTNKALLQKLNEEVDELKQEILRYGELDDDPEDIKHFLEGRPKHDLFRIAEEAADISTMATTIANTYGADEKTRFEAQAYVNKHNHERGRL